MHRGQQDAAGEFDFGEYTQGLSIRNERHVEMTVMFP